MFLATVTARVRYGRGIGLATPTISIARAHLPKYTVIFTFCKLGLAMVVLIVAISSHVAVRKDLKIEPFDIFNGA